ncbi:MAG: hypothetical protein ACFE96_15115, partial [Candidatus Hermodarchaeota archaeon]
LMDFGGEVFPFLLESKYELYGFVRDYYWMDAGNYQTYMWANWDLLRRYAWPISPNGDEYDGVYVMGTINSGKDITIEKPTCFGECVKLNDNVKIRELTSIGNKVNIGEDAIIEKSVIWDNVKIGSGCYINESIICNDCTIGHNVVLERVIVPPYCKISSNNQLRDITLEIGKNI